MANQDNKLAAIALQIVQAGVRVSQIHQALDNHVKYGSIPVPQNLATQQPTAEMSRGTIARILCNYPPNITKARKKLAHTPPSDPEHAILLANIATWEADLHRARAYKDQE